MIRKGMNPKAVRSIAEKAHQDLARAVELDPRDVYSRSSLAESLYRLERHEESIDVIHGSLELAPFHRNVLLDYANYLLRHKHWDRADAAYRAVSCVGRTQHNWKSAVRGCRAYIRQQKELGAASTTAVGR